MTTHPNILIVGPTAGGKTALSIALAQRLPGGGECICADSMQIYRGMDIGTAKPTAQDRAAAPHRLIDIADPVDGFTVDHWLAQTEQTIADIRSRGRWPIIVGGTNLYIQAFIGGMFDGPAPDPELRSRLGALPSEALHAQLTELDPVAADRIHINDRKRAIRALEVFHTTGQQISALQQQWDAPVQRSDVVMLGLDYPAETINPRINARVRQMIDDGLVEEVRRLYESDRLGIQAREALGYKQIIDHLEGRCTLEEAVEQIKIRTRRFAKQQRTWLRRFRAYPNACWIDCTSLDAAEIVERALDCINAKEP